jgi:serine/threonine protein kinase
MTPERWQQIKDIFECIVDFEPSDRIVLLEVLCGTDGDLRREIEVLLESDKAAQGFLATSLGSPQRDPFAPLSAGRMIGPYRIISLLGAGGMGEVYKSEDTRLGLIVALKILPADVAGDRDRMKRFTIEAKAASALDHSNVATIYGVGESDGISYIAMEYVKGQTLEQKIKSGPMSAVEIRTIARQVAEALDAAHRIGIIHRDIKPANLMVTPRGQVKVLDFGLAKISRQTPLQHIRPSTSTLSGLLMGTAEYMSPEQVLGRQVDNRTDIFSLGVVLYEMATCQSPFAGNSIGETFHRIVSGDPIPISRHNPKIPVKLQRVIHKCLERKRERRYQSAQELLVELRENRLSLSSFGNGEVPGRERALAAIVLFSLFSMISHLTGIEKNESTHPESVSRSADATATRHPVNNVESRTVESATVPDLRNARVIPDFSFLLPPRETVADQSKFRTAKSDIPTVVDNDLFLPPGIALGPEGSIYLSDTPGARIYKVTPSGQVLTIAGTGRPGFSGDRGPATSAQLHSPGGIALDGTGNLYVCDFDNFRIRKITPDGMISTIAGTGNRGTEGDGGLAIMARLDSPRRIAVEQSGSVYFIDALNVREITPNGIIRKVTSLNSPAWIEGTQVNEGGNVLVASILGSLRSRDVARSK